MMLLTMSYPMWLRVALIALGVAIVIGCLCRARHMTQASTVAAIRYATTALAGAGFSVAFLAALRPSYLLGALLAMSAAALTIQLASSYYWRRGLPEAFRR